MKSKKITLFLLLLLSFSIISFSQEKFYIKGNIYDTESKTIYLKRFDIVSEKFKSEETIVDSSSLQSDNSFVFNLPANTRNGVYKISWGTKNQYNEMENNLFVIFKSENIAFSCREFKNDEKNKVDKVQKIIESLIVKESNENEVFYRYLQTIFSFQGKKTKLEELAKIYNKFNEKDKNNKTSFLYAINKEINSLSMQIIKFKQDYFVQNANSLAVKVIKLNEEPVCPEYISLLEKGKTDEANQKQNEWIQKHFFDNVDFSSEAVINTDFFNNIIKTYITQIARVRSEDEMIKVIDYVMSKMQANNEYYKKYITLLEKEFEKTMMDKVYTHILEEYVLVNTCSDDVSKEEKMEKLKRMKLLQVGNVAPDLNVPDANGKNISLYSIKKPLKILIFWSSTCPHCTQEMLPNLMPIYKEYKSKGLEVYAVSIEKDKESWEDAIKGTEWINVSEIKWYDSESAKTYNVWGTPFVFILDQDNKIVAKNPVIQQIKQIVSEMLN